MAELRKTDVLQRRPVLMRGTVPSPSPVKTPFCQSSVSLSALMCHSLVSFLAFVCLSCCAFACTNQGHISEMYVQVFVYRTIIWGAIVDQPKVYPLITERYWSY